MRKKNPIDARYHLHGLVNKIGSRRLACNVLGIAPKSLHRILKNAYKQAKCNHCGFSFTTALEDEDVICASCGSNKSISLRY